MNRSISYCALMCWSAIVVVLAISKPALLSDQNSFLKNFIPHEFLAIIGVMLTITLASAGQIHLSLNSVEEKHRKIIFNKTRGTVKKAAYWMISIFFISIFLVVSKPYFENIIWAETLFNGAAILFMIWTTLIMSSLSALIFAIRPDLSD